MISNLTHYTFIIALLMRNFRKFGIVTVSKKGGIKILTYAKFKGCIRHDCSIVSSGYGERQSIGFYDSRFESTLSKEWCVPELRDNKANFFVEMNQTLLEIGVNHFACATFNQLLGIVSQVGEEICTPLFIARVSHDEWEEITIGSCFKCNNYRIENGGGEQLRKFAIYVIC